MGGSSYMTGDAMRTEERSLKNFILAATDQLTAKVERVLAPIYTPGETDALTMRVKSHIASVSKKKPYAAQLDAVCALMKGFRSKRCLGLVAEMGTGKTLQGCLVGMSMSLLTGTPTRTLVLCPPHLVSTWEEELHDSFGKAVRVVNASGPEALSMLVRLRKETPVPDKPEFWIMGFNRAKTSFRWKPAWFTQCKIGKSLFDDTGKPYSMRYTVERCERCGNELPAEMDRTARNLCPYCGNPLWGPARKVAHTNDDSESVYAPILYIKKYLNKHFQLAVFDEAHKLKGAGTIQGAMLGQIASALPRTLVLTGTLSGGKASDVYFLLQRAFALNYRREERRELLPKFDEVIDFVRSYGSLEEVYTRTPEDRLTGRASRDRYNLKEKPGISPELLKQFFLEHCVFLRIADISDALPPYREELEFCDMSPELADAYTDFERELTSAAKTALRNRDMRVMGQMLSTLLAWPDMPQNPVEIYDRDNRVVASAPGLELPVTAKDERLVECVRDAKAAGRKCLVFVEYTGRWQTGEHVQRILTAAGFNFLQMKPTVPTHTRLDWIRARMSTGQYDGLICQPKLVETGLNLREFPEICFYQTGYSTYVLRQASRRSWRPGQTKEVVVRFFINRNTMQETAMTLIASKLEASLVLEGELSDKGLVALSEIGDSMAVELARPLVGELEPQSLEAQFKAYRKLEEAALPVRAISESATDSTAKTALESVMDIVQPTPHAQTRKVFRPLPAASPLGMRVGSLSGLAGGKARGNLLRATVSVSPDPHLDRNVLLDKHGLTLGYWENDTLHITAAGKIRGTYQVVPDNALPGFVAWSIHQLAA